MNNFFDTDELNYYPLQTGKVPASSVSMKRLSKLEPCKQKVFQIDQWTKSVLLEKQKLQKSSDGGKYYSRLLEGPNSRTNSDLSAFFVFMVERLTTEYPDHFTTSHNPVSRQTHLVCRLTNQVIVFTMCKGQFAYKYHFDLEPDQDPFAFCPIEKRKYGNGFETLAMQVPEDLVFYAKDPNDKNDIGQVSLAHLMSAADWSAEWAVGKTFSEIHKDVARVDNNPVIKSNLGMVRGIMSMPETVERVGAISFRTNYKLNLHPDVDPEYSWTFDDKQELYIRFERQTVTPLPNAHGFLFTIKPYYANLLDPTRIKQAIEALKNIDENSYYRNLLHKHGESIIKFLDNKRDEYEEMGILQD